MARINIIFHSVSGNTFRLAEAMATGVVSIPGVQAQLLRIAEPHAARPIVMSGLERRHHEFEHVPEASVQNLVDCDGLAIGSPVYWGSPSYATKHFLDSAARLWVLPSPEQPVNAPQLALKPATIFTGGGSGLAHDPAILSLWTTLGFFGMTIVTLGIGAPHISDPTRYDGGSPLGAGTFSRRPGPHPTEVELAIAHDQGRRLAEVTRAWSARPID